MNIIYRLFLLFVACTASSAVLSQTVKRIEVAAGSSYTDHISLKEDATDMDVMVKFVFDEPKNMLTVSLISYRGMFVFRDDARYGQVVRCRKLRPERLPYVVETEPGSKYKITGQFRKSIPCPRRKHVFKRWIDYRGLQPVPTDYKMVNSYIEQAFDILNKDTAVSVTLQDLVLMEPAGGKKKKKYELLFLANLGRQYEVIIRRNPCLGQEEAISNAQKSLKAISAAYQKIHARYSKPVTSAESYKVFKDMKSLLVQQFPKKDSVSQCPDIQQQWDAYNLYVDSISKMKCTLVENTVEIASDGSIHLPGVKPGYILSQARSIDMNVSRWLLSKDRIERSDLERQCDDIIEATNKTVKENGLVNAEQQNAMGIFRRAERYFRSTCKNY